MLARIRNILFKNLPLKVLSLLLSAMLWLLVNGEGDIQKTVRIPVAVKLPEGYMVSNLSTKEVTISLLGNRLVMMSADLTQLGMQPIELNERKTGTITTILKAGNFSNVPSGLEVIQIDPAKVIIDIDRRMERAVPLVVETVGAPAEGYELDRTSSNPAVVQVSGPETLLEPLRQIFTEPVDITGLVSRLSVTAQVSLPAASAISVDPLEAKVEIEVKEIVGEKGLDFEIQPPALPANLELVSMTPRTIRVKLQGPLRLLEEEDHWKEHRVALDFEPPDAGSRRPGRKISFGARVAGADGPLIASQAVSILGYDPQSVKVTVVVTEPEAGDARLEPGNP